MISNASGKPTLFYASRCGKCRILSQLVVWAAFQQIQRIPIESEAAAEFYQTHPEAKEKLVLFHPTFQGGKLAVGVWVYPLVPWTIVSAWLAIGVATLRTLSPRNNL
jgi:predicted DCC family thiol-disulfide oxidoreductase YuxK